MTKSRLRSKILGVEITAEGVIALAAAYAGLIDLVKQVNAELVKTQRMIEREAGKNPGGAVEAITWRHSIEGLKQMGDCLAEESIRLGKRRRKAKRS